MSTWCVLGLFVGVPSAILGVAVAYLVVPEVVRVVVPAVLDAVLNSVK